MWFYMKYILKNHSDRILFARVCTYIYIYIYIVAVDLARSNELCWLQRLLDYTSLITTQIINSLNTTGISSLYTYCEIYINQQQIRSIFLRTDSNNPAFMEIQLTIYRFVFRFKVSMSHVIVRVSVFNATFNNISIISWVAVSFICEENQITQRKPLTCGKSLTNFIT
jgi:hypothetical protein